MGKWQSYLNDLIDLFSGIFRTRKRAELVLRRAGLPLGDIDLDGGPEVMWLNILEEAYARDKVQDLIDVVKKRYPNLDFPAMQQRAGEPNADVTRLKEKDWKGPPMAGEKWEIVTGTQPTFLPISFLATGLERSKAVVRLDTGRGLGTGFLARGNLLITNHHVIPNEDVARRSRILFNFQMTAEDLEEKATPFGLDPDAGFATSPAEDGDDWTAVRVKGDASGLAAGLDLLMVGVETGEFVQIIQHPSGMPKQIALYHNVVAFVGERRIQYLTDTMPGSSGSPVFDKDWRVVALHHKGGWLPETGKRTVFLRNQGVRIGAVIEGLTGRGLFP